MPRDDDALFAMPGITLPPGRVRKGLDAEIAAARADGADLGAAGVAVLRSLADQIDQLERQLRSPKAGAYDRVPLSGLVRQFDDTYTRVFAALHGQSDPFAAALAGFLAADSAAATGDPAEPGPPD